MSKERLEEIRKRLVLLHNAADVDDETKSYIFEYLKVEWLIEQAERVQELEEVIRGNFKDRKHMQDIIFDLEQQNKRYSEALVEIINVRNHFYATGYVFGVEGIARKALEGEE